MATLVNGEIIITDRPTPPETLDQIKSRKFEEFIASENIEDFDWE
jgi:hypothetical protein